MTSGMEDVTNQIWRKQTNDVGPLVDNSTDSQPKLHQSYLQGWRVLMLFLVPIKLLCYYTCSQMAVSRANLSPPPSLCCHGKNKTLKGNQTRKLYYLPLTYLPFTRKDTTQGSYEIPVHFRFTFFMTRNLIFVPRARSCSIVPQL